MTAAVEAAEIGYRVVLVEKEPSLGGRVVRTHRYFPKMCPPTCGFEINARRIRQNPRITVHTLATVEEITGDPSATEATWSQVKYYQLNHGDMSNSQKPYPPGRFPTVRCYWHAIDPDADNENIILNLSHTGRVFESGPKWEDTASD